MRPFSQEKSSLDRILWVVVFIGMVASALAGPFSLGTFFLMPVPLIVLNVLISPVNAGVMILLAALLFGLEQGTLGGVAFFLLIGVFSQMQGFMIRRNSRVSRILFWGMVFFLAASMIVVLLSGQTAAGTAYLSSMTDNLKTAIMASSHGENVTTEDLAGLLPFIILYMIFVFNGSNFFLSRWILQNRGISVIPLGNLSEFQLPQHIAGGAALMLAMGSVLRITGWYAGTVLIATIIYLTAFIFMFQGLASCSYFMKRQGVPPIWHNGILTVLFVLAGPIGLGLAGLADVLMDLRKQRRTGRNQG